MTIMHIAKLCHAANRAYCETIGDLTQKPWDHAPTWQQVSALNGVTGVLNGSVASPEESHEQWCKEKSTAGWVWGPFKSEHAQPPTHPCLVPYSELPELQRIKDALFFYIVETCKPFVSSPA